MRISGWSSDVCSSDLQWLEEAAGISKYKDRRKETESRIKQTRENLSRLNDLRSEIQQRLEVLTKQAAKDRTIVGEGKSGSGRVGPVGRRIIKKTHTK